MSKANPRSYEPESDWMRIRALLIETFAAYGRPYNWLIDRWNFCRYHVIPLHTYYNVQYFGVPTRPGHPFRDELPFWEKSIGVWEDGTGRIVAVAHSENEEPGEAWFQVRPGYHWLYDELVTYAEERLADRVDGLGYVKLHVNDGSPLEAVAAARGYRKLKGSSTFLVRSLDHLPPPKLPDGFCIKSVLDEDDVDKRRIAKAVAFGGNYAPSDWPPASAFREMQRAPDYRADLDLYIEAPDGEVASFCTIWLDEENRYANLEPVGTRQEHQGMGLGRALLREAFRRMADRGATRSFMDSANPFYHRMGFHQTPYTRSAWIRYFAV